MTSIRESQKVILLLPYGVFEQTNQQYAKYLDEALDVIKSEEVDVIVVAGGLTKEGMTEARSIGKYLVSLDPHLSNKLVYEEESITTPQNLEFAGLILDKCNVRVKTIKVICDSIRVPKVAYFALSYYASIFGSKLTGEQIFKLILDESVRTRADISKSVSWSFEQISVMGISLDRSVTEIGQQVIATMEEVAAHKYPAINEEILRLRKLQWQMEIKS